MLWSAFIHLKPKVHNVTTIFAFAFFFFFLYLLIYGQLIGCMVLSLYYLALMWKSIQDPGITPASLFPSVAGTLIVCLLKITQN